MITDQDGFLSPERGVQRFHHALDPNLYPGGHLLERTVVLICTGGIYKSRNPIHLMEPSCYNLSSVIDL